MKLVLVRHAESKKNAGTFLSGDKNELSSKGVLQALELGNNFLDKKINWVYCSPTMRCEQTLDALVANREGQEFGIGFTRLLSAKRKLESYEKLKTRVETFLDDLNYDHEQDETIVIISHQRVLAMILLLLGKEVFGLKNGEMVEVDYRAKELV